MVRQRGVALLGVLWAGVVLAILAGAVSDVSRGDLDLARNQLEGARTELAALAAAEVAIYGLLGGEAGVRMDGAVHAWLIDDIEVRVQATPEATRIDLNQADEATLSALFAAAGADTELSQALAAAVLDYRDPDDLPGPNGAEDDDYAAAGLPFGAKDAPFESVAELAGVLGMTGEIYRRAAPGLTAHGGRRQITGAATPPIVAMALGEMVPETAEPAPAFSLDLGEVPTQIAEPFGEAGGVGGLAHLHAEAAAPSGALHALDLVVQLRQSPDRPYRPLSRRRGAVELFAAPGETAE